MSSILLGSSGFVYAMSCGAMPGLIKLGATTSSPVERARQLTASTSSPAPFVVLYSREVSDCNAAEALLHERFANYRVNDKREFFGITLEQAAFSMDKIAAIFPFRGGGAEASDTSWSEVANMKLPWSELFASFPDDWSDRELTPEERAKCRQLSRSFADVA